MTKSKRECSTPGVKSLLAAAAVLASAATGCAMDSDETIALGDEAAPLTKTKKSGGTDDPGAPGGAGICESTTALTHGILYRPGHQSGSKCIPTNVIGGLPLLVFAHGNGYHSTEYSALATHLASHGFVVVSTHGNGAANLQDALSEAMTAGLGLSGRIALGGHSRGAEVAIAAAKMVRDAGVYDVDAVISLSSKDGDGNALTADASRGLLMLYGSVDEDITGREAVPLPFVPPTLRGTPFSLWDRSGLPHDAANPETTPRNYLRKSLIYVQDADHRAFTDRGTPEQRELANAYVHAYLRAFLLDESAYEDFFDGLRRVPSGVAADGLEFDLTSRGLRRAVGRFLLRSRVIDNFERPGAAHVSTNGSSITEFGYWETGPCWSVPSHQIGNDRYPCPHDTNIASFIFTQPTWGTTSVPHMTWTMPPHGRDFSLYRSLSLRVGALYESMFHDPSPPTTFDITLRDAWGNARSVNAASFGEVYYPEQEEYVNTQNIFSDWTKSAMTQLVVPLKKFSAVKYGVDLTNITQISLSFPDGEGQVVFDDLELTF